MKYILMFISLNFSFISYATENKSEDDTATASTCDLNSEWQQENLSVILKSQCSTVAKRVAVVQTLGQVQLDKLQNMLLESFLKDPHYAVRVAAVQTLEEIYPYNLQSAQVLAKTLDDSSDAVREAAARSIVNIQSTDSNVLQIITEIALSQDTDKQKWARWTLKKMDFSNCQNVQSFKFIKGLSGIHQVDEEFAVIALGGVQLNNFQSVQTLADELTQVLSCSSELGMKHAALYALGGIQPDNFLKLVVQFLDDPSYIIRGAAVRAIGKMNLNNCQSIQEFHLIKVLSEDPYNSIRESAAYYLGMHQIDSIQSHLALTKALSDSSDSVQEAAVRALSNIKLNHCQNTQKLKSSCCNSESRVRESTICNL